jgi:4a-hydroxytetrahydrobiopterin dehydratase
MNDSTTPISPSDFHATAGLEDWRVLGDGAYAHYRTADLAASARFVLAIAAVPSVADHPPAIDVRPTGVTIRIVTARDDFMGLTTSDVEAARAIATLARETGLRAVPEAVQHLLVVPGAPTGTEIFPFWRAILGYEPRPDSPDEDLVDPHDRGPAFWFEAMADPRADGGGAIHIAVWLPADQAEARVAAALAAGGRIVRDQFAPSWWTLADAAGNEADVATVSGRD